MLELATLFTLQVPPPPEPPRIVDERTWLSDAGRKAQTYADRLIDHYSVAADQWLKEIAEHVAAYDRVQPGPGDAATLAGIEEWAVDVEALAERRAAWRSRFAKRSQREAKRLFQIDPSVGAVARATAGRLLATDDRVIAGLLDYALFLRAVRAERTADAGRSRTFDDPKEMIRSLRTAIGA